MAYKPTPKPQVIHTETRLQLTSGACALTLWMREAYLQKGFGSTPTDGVNHPILFSSWLESSVVSQKHMRHMEPSVRMEHIN